MFGKRYTPTMHIDDLAVFEIFIPVPPVPKSYRISRGRTSLGDKCRKYQHDVSVMLEKHAPEKPFDAAMWVEYTFYMTRPLSGKDLKYPERKPDTDNLVKSLQDCLERANIVKNDSRIVMVLAKKVFCAGQGSDDICQPGAQIRLGFMS